MFATTRLRQYLQSSCVPAAMMSSLHAPVCTLRSPVAAQSKLQRAQQARGAPVRAAAGEHPACMSVYLAHNTARMP